MTAGHHHAAAITTTAVIITVAATTTTLFVKLGWQLVFVHDIDSSIQV